MASKTLTKYKNELMQEILQSDLHGKRVYLIGSAEFGPTNEPLLIKSTVGLYNKFGKYGTLIDAFHALKYVDRNNEVYLVKTTGEHAKCFLNVNIFGSDCIKDGFIIAASESNEIYNDVSVMIDIDGITISFPDAFNLDDKTYLYKDYPTIERLATAINEETSSRKNKLYAYYTVDPGVRTETAFFSCNQTMNYMYGGYCGLNYSKNMLYNCLARTYDMLESEDIDIIIPVDACLDDIYPNDSEELEYQYDMKYYHSTKDYLTQDVNGNYRSYLNQLINFCVRQLNFGVVTHGIIGFNTMYTNDFLYEADDVSKMLKACLEWNIYHVQDKFHTFLVSATCGDIRYNYGTIIANSCYAYAALMASIKITEGTTNIPVDNISLYTEFSEEVLPELADAGLVAFRHSPLYEAPVVYAGITLSVNDENLRLLVNVRMCQLAISYLNKLYQFYIGQNLNELIDTGIINTDSNTILRTILSRNIINNYTLKLKPDYSNGTLMVYLTMQTNYMTKDITISTQINSEFSEQANG